MNQATTPEPLEAFPLPDGAIELPAAEAPRSERAMAVSALQQVLRDQSTQLPFGPQNAADDATRLLSLNRFAVQLVTSGLLADQVAVDLAHWVDGPSAPQLLLAAQVDEENEVVAFSGVLTGPEFLEQARSAEQSGDAVLLVSEAFRGGIERLLTLVQVLEPHAIPRLAFEGAGQRLQREVVAIADWLGGQVDGALQQLFGAQWQPITQGAFFSGAAATADAEALALVAIPLALAGTQLVCGEAAERCVERFVLQMLATGPHPSHPTGLVLRVTGAMAGDLLPDGLQITARQGSHEQRQVASADTAIELMFQANGLLIDVGLSYPGSTDLVLPPLQLPG